LTAKRAIAFGAGTLILFGGLCGCASIRSASSAAVGGPNAPWRGKDLVGPAPAASLTDEQIEQRIAFLDRRLDQSQTHSFLWQYGWMAVNGGGGVASGVQAGLDHGNDRIFDVLEAVKSGIGVVYLVLRPMPGWRGAGPIRAMPDATRADRIARLRRAEEMLREAAEHARRRKYWLVHLGNLGLNAATGAILLGLGSTRLAVLSAGLDTAIGEAQIWSRPWQPEEDWKEYERFVATGRVDPSLPPTTWRIGPAGRGIALQARF
jgi:hypothetical protein